MDFARKHVREESATTRSNIRYIEPDHADDAKTQDLSLDQRLLKAANEAAADCLLGPQDTKDVPLSKKQKQLVDATLYFERMTPPSNTIQANELVVIFESFDNLNFTYAQPGEVFSNRNGNFHHDDFIGKPYGCKLRSRNYQGYGFCYLLKPTPELWARSLKHRTQIVHELDSSMIVFQLNLRPNMTVVESGTGSGAMSHCILRTIAPHGKLHTFEFNKVRADTARQEFAKNKVGHLVEVYHGDVCGMGAKDQGGFSLPQASVDAMFLDLPEPWWAIPHAAHVLKPSARIVTYSPCVEQSQKTLEAMKKLGFHSFVTKEFRLQEHYVDEYEMEMVPREKRPPVTKNPFVKTDETGKLISMSTTIDREDKKGKDKNTAKALKDAEDESDQNNTATAQDKKAAEGNTDGGSSSGTMSKKLVARPFVTMRGHTAFLTFATAGNKLQPDPLLAEVDKKEAPDK